MSEKITTKLGTPVESLAHVTSLARDFLVTRRRVFRSTESILRQDRSTRTALDQSGGLDTLLSNNQDPEAERSFLSSFSNLQQTLFVDRVTNSDLLKTPTLEEMYESSKKNGKIATAIKSALDDCCKQIQNKIDQLSNLVKKKFNQLFDYLAKNLDILFKNLEDNFEIVFKNFHVLYDNLLKFYQEEKQSFSLGLESYKTELTDFIATEYNFTKENIDRLRDDVYATPDIVIVNIRDIVDMARDQQRTFYSASAKMHFGKGKHLFFDSDFFLTLITFLFYKNVPKPKTLIVIKWKEPRKDCGLHFPTKNASNCHRLGFALNLL